MAKDIEAIVFDLDGTLYVCEPFEEKIWESASRYAGLLLGVSPEEGGQRLSATRKRLKEERGTAQTLAGAIEAIGGDIRELHARFAAELDPEGFIAPDPRVLPLITTLAQHYRILLLTNNNRTLTTKILRSLSLEDAFERVITINETWRPKPDESLLDELFHLLALPPEKVLFVGDRYDIDLRLPAARSCPVLLTRNIDELMALESLIP